MTPRLNLVLAALLLIVALPGYWLLIDNRPGDARAHPLTITQLRELAGALPGPAPTAIAAESVAWRRLPGTLLSAGTGLKRQLTAKLAYQLTVPGRGPIVIDTGLLEAEAKAEHLEAWNVAAEARVMAAMRGASLILLTHEHPDHAGGLVALATDDGVAAHVRLSSAQLPPAPLAARLGWPAASKLRPTLDGTHPEAVAPGVVVIPAPSHTPGSQMIYVRLASGREYLFTGDIATMASNWTDVRARSRLVSQYMGEPENRAQIYAWLLTIRALKAADPALVVVPGHDIYALFDDSDPSGITQGFAPPPAQAGSAGIH